MPSKAKATDAEKMTSCISNIMVKEPGMSKERATTICKARLAPKTARSAGEQHSRPVQSPIRSIGDGRYECYAVRFNSPADKDMFDTYFDAETRYYLDYYTQRPWLYDHGLNSSVGRAMVGVWDEIDIDDKGVFVRGELHQHHKYRSRIEELIDAEVLYPSSGAVSRTIRVADDGHVEDWAIDEVSSTVRPADWRMLSSISPAARSAMDAMLDEYIVEVTKMGLKDELIRALSGRSAEDVDAEIEAEVEVEVEVETETEIESTEGTEGTEDTDTNAVLDEEFVRGLVEGISAQLVEIRTAVIGIDAAVAAQGETVQTHAQLLASLAETETVRTQRALTDGSWLTQLHTASRSDDSPEPDEDEAKDARSTPALAVAGQGGWQQIQIPVQ